MNDEERNALAAILATAMLKAEIQRKDVIHVLLRASIGVLRQQLTLAEIAEYLRERSGPHPLNSQTDFLRCSHSSIMLPASVWPRRPRSEFDLQT